MGVAGAGKTTLGRALAQRLGWAFEDADAFHTPEAVAKMRRGEGLTDADRAPWLGRLANLVGRHLGAGKPLVLACSVLKDEYRRRLAQGDPRVRFVWLDPPTDVLAARLGNRADHFAGPDLLGSQLRDLEPPAEALRVTTEAAPAAIAEVVIDALGLEA